MRIDEKDLFVFAFGILILISYFLGFSVSPFRRESLVAVFIFLLTIRSLVDGFNFFPYLMVAMLGLLFSTFLSPYSLLIYFIIALLVGKKTNLL